jgi:predicted DNA-binding transcriptional regulator
MRVSTEKNYKISPHEVRVYQTLLTYPAEWMTNREIAAAANVKERTARHHTFLFVAFGIADVEPVFPGYKYRLADKVEKRNCEYFAKLEKAFKVLKL